MNSTRAPQVQIFRLASKSSQQGPRRRGECTAAGTQGQDTGEGGEGEEEEVSGRSSEKIYV